MGYEINMSDPSNGDYVKKIIKNYDQYTDQSIWETLDDVIQMAYDEFYEQKIPHDYRGIFYYSQLLINVLYFFVISLYSSLHINFKLILGYSFLNNVILSFASS